MIRFRISGVSFCLPLLTLLMPLLAARLGMRESLIPVLFSLGLHEAAHLFAAKLMHVEITEIRIMPFGGSARMENPYNLPPIRLIVTAAAGPFANLLMIVLSAALAQWHSITPAASAQFIRTNITMMLFNMLPVLPLDGGRILFAILEKHTSESAALRIGLWPGRILCLFLACAAVWGWSKDGKLNISMILAAVFILSSEKDEKNALIRSKAERISHVLNKQDAILPVKTYEMDSEAALRDALSVMRPRESAWFILMKDDRPCGCVNSRMLIDFILDSGTPDVTLAALLRFSRQNSGAQPFRTSSI